jgi:DNA mismatch endonuclease (patch repair protein)
MPDIVDRATRSRMMSNVRVTDTEPELVVRRFLHRRGFRYRLNAPDLPGRPDVVLPKHRAVIFVNGCFWHAHEGCALFQAPKTRQDFWNNKLMSNRERDTRNRNNLLSQGWRVATVWECATRDDLSRLARLVGWIRSDQASLDIGC